MTGNLVQWFLYSIVVSIFAAYVAGISLAPGAEYLEVFQITGAVAFTGYALGLPQNSIWWSRSWGATIRSMIDGLIYGLLTGGRFRLALASLSWGQAAKISETLREGQVSLQIRPDPNLAKR